MNGVIPCLWFDRNADSAARFYTTALPDARLGATTYYGEDAPMPAGTVMTVQFTILGQPFMALNGGPHFTFSPAVSFVIPCETQKDIDTCWEKLSDGGATQQGGWLQDRYGVSWQIIPRIITELLQDPDRHSHVMKALLQREKVDISALLAACDTTR